MLQSWGVPIFHRSSSIIYFITIIVTPWEIFTAMLADCLSIDLIWQSVSLSLRDSFKYFDSILDGLCLSSDFYGFFAKHMESVSSAPITMAITVTILFQIFTIIIIVTYP